MKALVTGGAGFIGSHTVRALLDRGHAVTVIDNLTTGHRDAIDARAVYVNGRECNEIENAEMMLGVLRMEKPDVVLHFAGRIQVAESVKWPQLYWRMNVTASLTLLDAVIAASRYPDASALTPFVFSSSAAVYGTPALDRGRFPKLTEEHVTMPVNPYGDTKLAFERALAAYGQAHALPWTALRYFNAAGANVAAGLYERHEPETHLIPILLDVAGGKRDVFTIHGSDFPTHDGTCVRDYVHVMDLADAHVLAAEKLVRTRAQLGPINLGTGVGHSVSEVVAEAREVTQKTIAVITGPRREGDPPYLVADPTHAERELGWRAQRDLTDILADAWHVRSNLSG